MSEHVGFVDNQFVTTPLETVDPMGEAVWATLRPQREDARSIRAAIDRVDDEQTKGQHRVTRLEDERRVALLRGTERSLSTIDVRLARASKWLERVNALAGALAAELAAAEAREAEAARGLADLKAAARPAIERYRRWVTVEYPKHAAAIAAGMEMERDVLAAAAIAGITNEVPRAYTSVEGHPRGMPPSTFNHLVRLPSHVPGDPIAWPAGEAHPDYAPNTIRY